MTLSVKILSLHSDSNNYQLQCCLPTGDWIPGKAVIHYTWTTTLLGDNDVSAMYTVYYHTDYDMVCSFLIGYCRNQSTYLLFCSLGCLDIK